MVLLTDPFAVNFFAEIRWPTLLPNVNDAKQFDNLKILWMCCKAQPPKHSTAVYKDIRIRPCRVSRVRVNIKNNFEVSIKETDIQIPSGQRVLPNVRFFFRHGCDDLRDATIQVCLTDCWITGTGHQFFDPA